MAALLIAGLALIWSCAPLIRPGGAWQKARRIATEIKTPRFTDRDYRVIDFGAVGDSTTDCYPAFRAAIDRCNAEGGGRVVVPAGIYSLHGPIHLKSHVHLHLERGSRIEFSSDPAVYLPVVLTRWEGVELFNYSPMVYAYQSDNIALTGEGILDGNASRSFVAWRELQGTDQDRLRQMGQEGVPLPERTFGAGHHLRPSMIQPYGCRQVLIEGITIVDAPFWIVHPTLCSDVILRDLHIDSWNPNNDGIDPDGCNGVLIEACDIYTGDDAIALKSGRDQDGWRIGRPTERVVIRNCRLQSKINGLCIGSEMSGGICDIYMEKCRIGEGSSTIYFKSNLDRGGVVERIFVRDIEIDRARSAVIRFESNYKGHRGQHHPPQFRDIEICDVICQRADRFGLYIAGVASAPISRVTLRRIDIRSAATPVWASHHQDIVLDEVRINGTNLQGLPAMADSLATPPKITF